MKKKEERTLRNLVNQALVDVEKGNLNSETIQVLLRLRNRYRGDEDIEQACDKLRLFSFKLGHPAAQVEKFWCPNCMKNKVGPVMYSKRMRRKRVCLKCGGILLEGWWEPD